MKCSIPQPYEMSCFEQTEDGKQDKIGLESSKLGGDCWILPYHFLQNQFSFSSLMILRHFAQYFAKPWISSWNSWLWGRQEMAEPQLNWRSHLRHTW